MSSVVDVLPLPAAADAKPKVQLRQLYWRKQQLNPRYTKRFGSVWQELAKVEPPREQLIHLFGSVEKEKAKTEVVRTCVHTYIAVWGSYKEVGGNIVNLLSVAGVLL